MARHFVYLRRCLSLVTSAMALKLISTLAILVLASFAYKVWDKTKVPAEVAKDDVWKVKTIDFSCRCVHKIMDIIAFFKGDVYRYGRPLLSFAFNAMHYGIWPALGYPEPTNITSPVVTYRTTMAVVPVTVYKNIQYKRNRSLPILIYFHGGGWQFFDSEDPSPTLRALTESLGIVTVSVDYRLSPEFPYPAGLEDCIRVTQYVLDRHWRLGIDPNKVMVAGDSAGGNLAAAVALKFQKKIRLQVLIYPILQMLDFHTSSYRELHGRLKYILNANIVIGSIATYGRLPTSHTSTMAVNKHLSDTLQSSKYMNYINSSLITTYVKEAGILPVRKTSQRLAATLSTRTINSPVPSPLVQKRATDPYFMPLMAENLDNSADAYIVLGHHDVLRDDGLLYHARLSASNGVKSQLKTYKDGFHTFIHFTQGPLQLESATRALSDLISFINNTVIYENNET